MREIQIIGNVTKDAEVRNVSAGKSVINFDVAINDRWVDRATREKKEKVTYVKCAIWRENTAVAQYITKGTKVYVEGTPEVDCYVNKEGKAVGSVKINVHNSANGLILLGGGKKNEGQPQASVGSDDFLQSDPSSDLPF